MTTNDISFIIPVYNRPDELEELLGSFLDLEGNRDFEIVVVEDGSQISSSKVVDKFINDFDIYLKTKYNNSVNTAWCYHKHMKKVLG